MFYLMVKLALKFKLLKSQASYSTSYMMKFKKELEESFLHAMKISFLEEFSIFLENSLFLIMILELISTIRIKSFSFSLMMDYLERSIVFSHYHQPIKIKIYKTLRLKMK
jgi:hypothetical protein